MLQVGDKKAPDLHYLAKSLLFAIPAVSIGIQISTWIGFALMKSADRGDFYAYYYAGYLLRTGQMSSFYHQTRPPAFGFIHPAYEALVFAPLSLLRPHTAYILWIIVGFGIVWVVLHTLRREISGLISISPIVPAGVTFSFFPISYGIAQGQDSLILLLLLALAFSRLKSADEFSAGLLLGLGIFRFQILVPMAVLFLLWKSWKILTGLLTSAAFACVLSLVMTGVSGQLQYLKLLRLLAQPANQDVQQMTNFRGAMHAIGVASPPIILIVSAFGVVATALYGRKLPSSYAFLLAVAASCLLSYHGFLHDFSLLLLPLLIVSDIFVARRDYLGLAFLGILITLPILVLTLGSVNALWVCSFIPLSLIFLLRYGNFRQEIGSDIAASSKAQKNCLIEVG